MTREGETYAEPEEAIFGPKAMIINEFAGSGGDAMPWYFRKAGIGPLVGMRTWGGLVGIGGYPAADGRRLRHRAALGHLRIERTVGSGEPRHRARHRSGA